MRSDTDLKLDDNSIVESVDEYGDQHLGADPDRVPQHGAAADPQHDRGAGDPAARGRRTELEWVHLGFDGDDEAMTERRLRQGNLIGAAGYISMEDGCVGGFVQRALNYNDDDGGVVMMGGHDAEVADFPRQRGGDPRLLEEIPRAHRCVMVPELRPKRCVLRDGRFAASSG